MIVPRHSLADVLVRFEAVRDRVGAFGTHLVAYEISKLWPEWLRLRATLPPYDGPQGIVSRTMLDFFARRLGIAAPTNREWLA